MFAIVTALAGLLFAQAEDAMGLYSLGRHLVAAFVFAMVGVVTLMLCVWVIDRWFPISFRKEILEDQNSALAIIVGALLLGISLIIAAAIHG